MRFSIEAYVGALPIRFGMSPAEVRQVLVGRTDEVSDEDGERRFYGDGLVVFFDRTDRVREVTFLPSRHVQVVLGTTVLMGKSAIPDPFAYLLGLESKPKVSAGIAVLFTLGVSIPFSREEQVEEPSLTVFREDCFGDLR